jgi:hypothetical protein
MSTLRIEVSGCIDESGVHKHVITIEAGEGVRGSAPPAAVRLQYTCPITGQPRIARFKPPQDAARPFVVTEVSAGW